MVACCTLAQVSLSTVVKNEKENYETLLICAVIPIVQHHWEGRGKEKKGNKIEEGEEREKSKREVVYKRVEERNTPHIPHNYRKQRGSPLWSLCWL